MSKDLEKYYSLIEQLLEGSISTEDHALLEKALAENQEVRRFYLRRAQLDSSLHFYADGDAEKQSQSAPPHQQGVFPIGNLPSVSTWVWGTLALGLLIGATAFLTQLLNREYSRGPSSLMVVSAKDNVLDWQVGQTLAGPIDVKTGVLALRTESGALISLEGPCEFEMVDQNVGHLKRGQLVVYCGTGTNKLTIKTDSGTYADLGTEFGVVVEPDNSSSLHVFDGQVFATQEDQSDTRVIEGASSIQLDPKGMAKSTEMADLAKFDLLRRSLSTGVVVETFEEKELTLRRRTPVPPWAMNIFHASAEAIATLENEMPIGRGLNQYMFVRGVLNEKINEDEAGFLEVEMDYSKDQLIDINKAHTIECVVRLDCDPTDVVDFVIYGAGKAAWRERSWQVRALQIDNSLMWSVFNSPQAIGSQKYQYLGMNEETTFHVLVEIDPEINRYRTTVSDGTQRIWNELYDGSPVSLQPVPTTKVFWRIRGRKNAKLAFSIDDIRIRNRPVFEDGQEIKKP